MTIRINSFNEILGDMVRKIRAETPVNDLNTGSVLLSLLEACASVDFENQAAALNILQLLNIDALQGADLDARAADYGLFRRVATRATGSIKISNTAISKRSSTLYAARPAPIAGQNFLYLSDTTGWANSGTLYIGRGTPNFEGPISYSSITVFPTYSLVSLNSALQNDHLLSEIVVDAQGQTDQLIPAGTRVKIPANNQTPDIFFYTLRDAVLPAGEESIDGIAVIAELPGTSGNANINTITQFDSPPFATAAVTNTVSFTTGTDVESDQSLRARIKGHPQTLSRGTRAAIISAVIGVSDEVDNKEIKSATFIDPSTPCSTAELYVDDGSGFEPTVVGQPIDTLLQDSNAGVQFLQLSNFPVTRPLIVNTVDGPYNLTPGSFIRVLVDGVDEVVSFNNSDFINIAAAEPFQVADVINRQAKLFSARLTNNSKRIQLSPNSATVERFQVAPFNEGDDPKLNANAVLNFPTREVSYIALYKNNERLREQERSASVETISFPLWNVVGNSDISISIDETPSQSRTFTLADFPGVPSFSLLTLEDWVNAFNRVFAGITAVATARQTMILSSNKKGAGSSINILSGLLKDKLFSGVPTKSVGQSSQFKLNRQTGQLKLSVPVEAGDNVTAGTDDSRGFIVSSQTNLGQFDLSNDSAGRPALAVFVADAKYCNRLSVPLVLGQTLSVTTPSSIIKRITSSTISAFYGIQPGDFVYITPRTSGWFSANNTGLFQVVAKGAHTVANVNTYIDLYSNNSTVETVNVLSADDIRAFRTDAYPQIWKGSYLPVPANALLQDIVDSINEQTISITAQVFKNNSVRITTSLNNGGSIAIPVSMGRMASVFAETDSIISGDTPLVANRSSIATLYSLPTLTEASTTSKYLGRYSWSPVTTKLTASSSPAIFPFNSAYSETYSAGAVFDLAKKQNSLLGYKIGSNRGQIRSIKAFISPNSVGTQQGTARTSMNNIQGDELLLIEPLRLQAEDSITFVLDKNPIEKTVFVPMWREGRVNGGSGGVFIPTTTQFSADDNDNEPGVNFSSALFWNTNNGTNFADYRVAMHARNWYSSGGTAGTDAKMLIRAVSFGKSGERLRFAFEYPNSANSNLTTQISNNADYSEFTCFMASGGSRGATISQGTQISVSGPYPNTTTNFPAGAPSTGEYYDYTFSAGSLASVQIGDIASFGSLSGVSPQNRGTFVVRNKSGLTIRVLNPKASVTGTPLSTVVNVTVVADQVGSATQYQFDTVADVNGSLDGKYFKIRDTLGEVAVWFAVNNSNTAEPNHGAPRSIRVATINTNDTASVVATKIADYLSKDAAFADPGTTSSGTTVTVVNVLPGSLGAGSLGTSGFSSAFPSPLMVSVAGVNPNSLRGKYFKLQDNFGSVGVWYSVDGINDQPPSLFADRLVRVNITSGMSATAVATATANAFSSDPYYTATASGAVVTFTGNIPGDVRGEDAGTSGFTVTKTQNGVLNNETISTPSQIDFYPLANNTAQDLVNFLNTTGVVSAALVGAGADILPYATREERYSWSSYSDALAYGHNPNNPNERNFIKLYDSEAVVQTFSNSNPNFTLKNPLILNGVAPSVYQFHTAPNPDGSTGEIFRLIPSTIPNVYHHLTQRALSQLPLVANINIADRFRNIEITSKLGGSSGAVQISGGFANRAVQPLFGSAGTTLSEAGITYMTLKIPAFPDTYGANAYVSLSNPKGVPRKFLFAPSDTMSVVSISGSSARYYYSPKVTGITGTTTVTIKDVSNIYGSVAGTVWRWTFGGSVTLNAVQRGDVMTVVNTVLDIGNNSLGPVGSEKWPGFPIVAVDAVQQFVDVINIHGKRQLTPIAHGGTIKISACPTIQWKLLHQARKQVISTTINANVVTMVTNVPHNLRVGDKVDVKGSLIVANGVYTVASTSWSEPYQFTFNYTAPNNLETNVGCTVIRSGLTETKYQVVPLGIGGLVSLKAVSGASPKFVSCGVSQDDMIVISGNTFPASTAGTYRVVAVSEDELVFTNPRATETLSDIRNFNNIQQKANWTSNSVIVSGPQTTFSQVKVGDWVKKVSDPDTFYRQVISVTGGPFPQNFTQLTLGAAYPGLSEAAEGVAVDQLNGYLAGVALKNEQDIKIYSGDSAFTGDTLFIQKLSDSGWFTANNTGSFVISQLGVDPTSYEPYVQVPNTFVTPQSGVTVGAVTNGFIINESDARPFTSIRQLSYTEIDAIGGNSRVAYVWPSAYNYKFSASFGSTIKSLGKLNYPSEIDVGVDGYSYYSNLLQKVQWTVDGLETDPGEYSGHAAAGTSIEVLPPVKSYIQMILNVLTDEGVTLNQVTDPIKSVVIKYVNNLGVGEPVVLSEIISLVMGVRGVRSVVFINPDPEQQFITVDRNQKAILLPNNINLT